MLKFAMTVPVKRRTEPFESAFFVVKNIVVRKSAGAEKLNSQPWVRLPRTAMRHACELRH